MPAVSSTKPVLSLFRANKKPLALFTLIVYASLPNLVVAQGVVSAINGKGVALEESANGTAVVNINKPSDGGVSRNEYNQFNVGEEGLILNNSPDIVATQLAGYIDGNSRLEGQQASIILNEVIGANPSQLLGYTEVAGQQAEVIIANQNGITCNGCGFINTPRATLTTGQLMFDGGQFSGFDVSKGKVDIGELGFNGSNVEQIDILARGIDINGDLWANQLNLITGQNTISTDLEQIDKNTLATSDESNTPEFSLDVAAIGGMYANRIRLVGTEQGLGVNLGGDVIATSNFTLDQSGNITNSGTVAANQIDFTAQSLTNNEKGKLISAEGGSAISLSGSLENSGLIKAETDLNIESKTFDNTGETTAKDVFVIKTHDNLSNSGVLKAEKNLSVDTQNLLNDGIILAKNGDLTLDANRLDNRRVITAKNQTINADTLSNVGEQAQIQSSNLLDIEVSNNLENKEGATLSSLGRLNLAVKQTLNNISAYIQSVGGLSIDAEALNNTDQSQITSQSDTDIAVANFENEGLIQGDNTTITSDQFTHDGAAAQLQAKTDLNITVNNDDIVNKGLIYAGQNLQLDALTNSVDNQNVVQAGNDISVTGTAFNNTSNAALLSNSGKASIHVNDVANQGSIVGNDIDIDSQTFVNSGDAALIQASNVLDVSVTQGDINNQSQATLYAGETLVLTAVNNNINNTNATIRSGNHATLNTNTLVNQNDASIIAKDGEMQINVLGLDNQAFIAGNSINIVTHSLNNQGSNANIQSSDALSINAQLDINNQDGALIYSGGNASISTQKNLNNSDAIINVLENFDFVGQAFKNYTSNANAEDIAVVQVGGNATVKSSQINNTKDSILAAENGELDIENSGTISNAGLIAGADVNIATNSISNSGADAQIQATDLLTIAATQTWYNKMGALIFSEGLASLSSQGYFYNDSGIVESLGALSIDAQRIYNRKAANHSEKAYLVSSGDMSLSGNLYNKEAVIQSHANFNQNQGLFYNYNSGVLKAVDGTANFNSSNWYNYGFVGGKTLNVTAKTIDNSGGKALVLAFEYLDMKTTSGHLKNQNGGVLYSHGSAKFDVKKTLLNAASYIESNSNMLVNASDVINRRDKFIIGYDEYESDSAYERKIEKHELPSPPGKKLWYANITYTEMTKDPKVIDAGKQGQILSGGTLELDVSNTLNNKYSTISSLGDMTINANVFNNEDKVGVITKTRDILYKWGTWDSCKYYESCGHKNRASFTDEVTDVEKENEVLASAIVSSGGTIKGKVNNLSNGELKELDSNTSKSVGDRRDDEVQVSAPNSQASDANVDVAANEIDGSDLASENPNLTNIDESTLEQAQAPIVVDSDKLSVDLSDASLDDLSHGALFALAANSDHGYLIETNPNFTEYQNFISSDYMLEKMGVDINEGSNTRLGDGYFEQDFIRDQILDLTGTQYVNDNQNIEDQYLALMDNGVEAKDGLSLSVGVALTSEQVQALDKPIVWMVEKEFETENGTQTALVPQVYFTNTMGLSLREDGALIAGNSVDLEATSDIANAGVIKAKDKLKLVANDIANSNKIKSINDIALVSHRDITNTSGLIDGKKITINAGRDFINETQIDELDFGDGDNYSAKKSIVGSTATINAQQLNITAGNDVKFIGSDLQVEGDVVVQAVNNIEMTTAKIIEEAISGNFYNVSSTQHQTTEIGAGTVLMIAGGTVKSEGAKVASDGNLEIDANDIQLLAVKNTEDKDIFYNYGGGDTEHTQSHSEEVIASAFTSDGVLTLSSKNDIISKGTQFGGKDGVNLSAEGNVLLATETALNTSRVDKTAKSSGFGGSTRRASTEINESLTHTGSSINSDGSITIQSGGNTALVGSTIEAGENVNLDATGDLLVSAAVNDSFNQYTKTKKGSFTQSSQNKGAKTQEAIASSISAGTNLNINTAGNVTVKGSDLSAQETMTIGDDVIAQSQDGSAQLSPDGQFVNQEGEQVGNVTVTTQELKNESWNEKSSGFSGILKDIASGVSLMVSSVAATAGIPVDAEIEVGSSSSERSQQTIQQASNLQAKNLNVDVAGDVAVIGSNATVQDTANIDAQSFTMDAAKESSSYSKTESTTTVSSSAPSIGENEITVANLSETKTSATETTTSTTWSGSSLNAGNLNINTDKAVSIVSSDVTVQGDTDIQAEDIVVSGRQDTTETTTTLKEEIKTVSVGVKNAYVDTAQAIEDLNSAKNAVRDAKQAYDDAKQKIAYGEMPASELKYFETNIAAATANLTNATIAVATAGATAAGTTGTGGFYATGNASLENNESSTTDTSSTWNGSNLNLGGNATLQAQDEIQIKGSNVAVGGALQLDAEDINLLAGENSTQTSSDSSSHTESASYSTNGGPSGGLSANKTESSSESQYYTNTQIVAGSLSSDSENLTLSGANVDAGVVDITTENLLVESLQNTSTSNSQTQGANLSLGGVAPPTSGGINQQQSESSSAWVDQQSSITGTNVSIKAKDTSLKGGLIAAQDDVHGCTNAAGAGCTGAANGKLNFTTDTLTVENIQDHDTSSDKGFSLNTGASTTTVGANYSGHDKRQTTKATIGNGNVQVGGKALADTDIDVNRDTNNAQEITKNHELGGLDASVTVDHRLASEEGRQDIANDFEDTAEHGQDIARATSKLIEDDNLNALNFGETLHNNAQATQLKNDLVRNPENAELLAGLKSDDPEVYAQAVKDLGQLAQAKFGLDLSEVDLYDGEKTTSGSLGDNALTDVKGGTVVDKNNANAGDIFVDAGDGASKTDMANTLGHEVLESQDFQGKDSSLTGGLFGTNTDNQQESLANAFGEQFSDRINQAAGGNLDSTGGADFSNNLKNSQAVQAGTQKANTVGNARVEHRQANINEATMLDRARARINREGTASKAEKAQALRKLDALACAEIQCAAGVAKSDPNYDKIVQLQSEGEQLKAETGEDIFSTLDELNIASTSKKETKVQNNILYTSKTVTTEEQEFQYGVGDEFQDVAAKADDVTQTLHQGSDVVFSAVVTGLVAPVVDSVEYVMDVNKDASFSDHMLEHTLETGKGAINYESQTGNRVLNSLRGDTFEEAPNYVLQTGAAALGLIPVTKTVSNTVDSVGTAVLKKVADKTGPKLDNSLSNAVQKSSSQPPKKVDYDVDNETGFDSLEVKRKIAESNKKANEDRLKAITAHTENSKESDQKIYENLKHSNKYLESSPANRNKRSASAETIRRTLETINEVAKEYSQ